MNTATLKLSVSAKKRIAFMVHDGVAREFEGIPLAVAERLQTELAKHENSDAAERSRIFRRYADKFELPGFGAWFRQWISDPDDDSVLCVQVDDPLLSSLPWGEILLPTGAAAGRAWIARVTNSSDSAGPPGSTGATPSAPTAFELPVGMLLVGWANLTGYPMPGVQRELNEFPRKVDKRQLTIQTLGDATRQQFLDACRKADVGLLHLSPPSLVEEIGGPAIPTTLESGQSTPPGHGAYASVSLTELGETLSKNRELRMVVVNACGSGLRGCNQISRDLNVVAIGWPALVTDDVAADFTFYFYQRLLEGWNPVSAVRSFARAIGTSRLPVEVPVVWLPSPKWASWRPFPHVEASTEPVPLHSSSGKPSRQRTRTASRRARPQGPPGPVTPLHPPGPLVLVAESSMLETAPVLRIHGPRIEFRPRASINPALLINGLSPIEHISIESPFEQDVHLCIECDTGADVSTFRQPVKLKKGVVPVPSEDIHFPALHELIDRHAGRRRVSFTASLTQPDGREISAQTRTAQWMGAREWLDQEETWAFIPAFVNPFDEGVLRVFESAKKVLRTLGDPGDSFCGYQRSTEEPDYVSTQMKAIFQTLRDDSIGLTYISPPGSPVYDPVSKRACGQVVRTHTEVVERKVGTCHDLALLLAACAEYVGILPLIILIPGHTFMGYWLSADSQDAYWSKRPFLPGKLGASWTIADGDELMRLLTERHVALIEATYVCEPKTFKEACSYRAEQFKLDKNNLDVAIDVVMARRAIQPL